MCDKNALSRFHHSHLREPFQNAGEFHPDLRGDSHLLLLPALANGILYTASVLYGGSLCELPILTNKKK